VSEPAVPDWLQPLATAARTVRAEQLSRFVPPADGSGRHSAVLMLFASSDGVAEADLLVLQRADTLRSHAGQVAFPGGKIDPEDESPVAAALREAREEVGLAPMLIEPIGYLDLYLTFSGFRILPTVARVQPEFTLTLNPGEVTETFEVPLDFLMAPDNLQRHSRQWKGIEREYYAVPFGDRYIWGITAGIVRNLYDRIYG
jgi:8-oxo-dGTP pyrophosphatase MutT (NUDIX family)